MASSKHPSSEVLLHYARTGLDVRFCFDDNRKFSPPALLADAFAAAHVSWQQKLPYDSVRAMLTAMTGGPTFELHGSPIQYSELRALKDCLADKPASEAWYGTSASLTVAVRSADGLILAVQRSAAVAIAKGAWTLGLTEGLDAADFQAGPPHPAVLRALREELNVAPANVPASAIKILAISHHPQMHSLNILVLADFWGAGVEFTSTALAQGAAQAPDAWEHEKVVFLAPTDLGAFTSGLEHPGTPLVCDILERTLLLRP